MRKDEYIICAAVHFQDRKKHAEAPENIKRGFVVAGRRHSDCYNTVYTLIDHMKQGKDNQEYRTELNRMSHHGFLANKNKLVCRKEAFGIAKAAGQLSEQVVKGRGVNDMAEFFNVTIHHELEWLVSEMLY